MGTEFGLKLALEQIEILRQSIAILTEENGVLKKRIKALEANTSKSVLRRLAIQLQDIEKDLRCPLCGVIGAHFCTGKKYVHDKPDGWNSYDGSQS